MSLTVAVPRSLASAPLLLMARDHAQLIKTQFFTDHDAALSDLLNGTLDLLCTGYSETERRDGNLRTRRLGTFVWGLSAVMVRDAGINSLADLSRYSSEARVAELTLPFAGSPLDLQVRALLRNSNYDGQIALTNMPLPETMQRWQRGEILAAVFPEPMATLLETAGKASRLGDLADLWAEVNAGERRSPQVALFCNTAISLPAEFMQALEASIVSVRTPAPADAHFIADMLGLPQAIVAQALQHVLFELPDSTTAAELESVYIHILAGC